MLFKIAQIISIHLGYFCGKNCHQGTFKNCPIWSHWKGRKISLVQIFSILRNIVNWQLWLNGAWGKSLTPSNSLVVSSANPAEKNLLNTNLIIHFSPHSATQREGMHWVLFNVVLIDANEQKIKRERETFAKRFTTLSVKLWRRKWWLVFPSLQLPKRTKYLES